MVLKITSQFPKLDRCNAFDASMLSDYPEEQEWLIGFMYMRILQVQTKKLIKELNSFQDILDSVPLSSWLRQEFIVIHLFQQQMFSMSENLEMMLAQYLRVNRRECCDKNMHKYWKRNKGWNERANHLCIVAKHRQETVKEANAWKQMSVNNKQRKDIDRLLKIYPVLWNKFNHFRIKTTVIKFDVISDILKMYFMEQINEKNIMTDKNKWIISFDEIIRVYPNAKELMFLNEYKFDKHIFQRLIKQIQQKENKLERVSFAYFCVEEKEKSDSYQMAQSLASYQSAVYGMNQHNINDSNYGFYDESLFSNSNQYKKQLLSLKWNIKLEKVMNSGRKSGEKVIIFRM